MSHDTIAIAPSILACDFSQLARELDSIRTADAIHFDVMDGHFVPNLSFGVPLLQAVKRVSSLPVDAHIMVSNPEEQIGWYIDAGADSITIHMEAQTHIHRMIYAIKNAGRKAAVAINPGSAIESLSAVLPDIDMILVMSVNPGFGGQSFIPTTTQKVAALSEFCHERGYDPLIEVDGGVTENNAAELARAGARMLVAGSSVFKHEDRSRAIAAIRAAAQDGVARA